MSKGAKKPPRFVRFLRNLFKPSKPVRDISAEDYERATGIKLQPVRRIEPPPKPWWEAGDKRPREVWWKKYEDGREPWPHPILPNEKQPAHRNPEPSGKSAQIALVLGIVLGLLPWGLGLIGLTVNLPLGAGILFIAFGLCVYAFWIWERASRWHVLLRVFTVSIAAVFYFWFVGSQVYREYKTEHNAPPITQRQKDVIENLAPEMLHTQDSLKVEVHRKTVTLRSLFEDDFSDLNGSWKGQSYTDKHTGATIIFTKRVYLDQAHKEKFVGFFIPSSGPGSRATRDICMYLAAHYQIALELEQTIVALGSSGGDVISPEEMAFNGRVYIYHEDLLSIEDRAAVIKQFRIHGAAVVLRGPAYWIAKVATKQSVKPPSQ